MYFTRAGYRGSKTNNIFERNNFQDRQIKLSPDGNYDFKMKLLKNVGEGIESNDILNKEQVSKLLKETLDRISDLTQTYSDRSLQLTNLLDSRIKDWTQSSTIILNSISTSNNTNVTKLSDRITEDKEEMNVRLFNLQNSVSTLVEKEFNKYLYNKRDLVNVSQHSTQYFEIIEPITLFHNILNYYSLKGSIKISKDIKQLLNICEFDNPPIEKNKQIHVQYYKYRYGTILNVETAFISSFNVESPTLFVPLPFSNELKRGDVIKFECMLEL